eukprot:CAMPEP_0115261328 /NCGR_PEP_ID=MMETSP0270-20121206/48803_1 /TAXON_ID=71861 /ORGANISM="Scrippsiella trochoidea, Strain CCMP3099" /LENGTH=55 /DNA_ID=CAMNT_0002677205 /DNA_START=105 /DNA_END=268 /DNA_ORIENTATION=+
MEASYFHLPTSGSPRELQQSRAPRLMPSLHQNVLRNLVMVFLLEGGEDVVQLGLL